MYVQDFYFLSFYTFVAIGTEPDFQSRSIELTFGPSADSRQEITVPIAIVDDLFVENDQMLAGVLSLNVMDNDVILSPSEASITIIDNDGKSEENLFFCKK